MGFPHDTPRVPGTWPVILQELSGIVFANDVSRELVQALSGGTTAHSGHVCATAWVFSPNAKSVLLVEHRRLGWSNPGGHIYPDESTFVGALRELEEETGLTRHDVRSISAAPMFVHVTDTRSEPQHRHWNTAWLFTADSKLALTEDHGATWWSIDALPDGPDDLEPNVRMLATYLLSTAQPE